MWCTYLNMVWILRSVNRSGKNSIFYLSVHMWMCFPEDSTLIKLTLLCSKQQSRNRNKNKRTNITCECCLFNTISIDSIGLEIVVQNLPIWMEDQPEIFSKCGKRDFFDGVERMRTFLGTTFDNRMT